MAGLCKPERAGDAAVEKLGMPGGKDSNPGKAPPPGAWRLPVSLSSIQRSKTLLIILREANSCVNDIDLSSKHSISLARMLHARYNTA